jgi:hypothetical protein
MSALTEAETKSAAGAPPTRTGTGTGLRDPDRVHLAGVVVRICFLIGAIVLFNAFPQWIGTYRSLDDTSSFVPLLAPEFQAHMPALNAWWALALTLNFLLLGLRRWTPATRWADLGLTVFGMAILANMLSGPPILAVHPGSGWPSELLRPSGAAWWLSKLGLSAALVVTGLSALKKLLALIRSGSGLVIARF